MGAENSLPKFTCECCRLSTKTEPYATVDGKVCMDCYDEHYSYCEGCGEVFHHDDSCHAPYGVYCNDCFIEDHFWCEDCGEATHYDWSVTVDDVSYCEPCGENKQEGEGASCLIDSKPTEVSISSNHDPYSKGRLVGIEAECIYPNNDFLESPKNWKLTHDGSITTPDGYSCVEWVSQPSNGSKLRETIVNLNKWAISEQAEVNSSCGLHIHIDATDTTWRDLVDIAIVGSFIEKHIYNMMPKSRKGSNWCRRIPISIERLRHMTSEEEFIDTWYDYAGSYPSLDKYNDARYIGLNMHARYYLGTIEFRYHSGTLNKTKITNWIKICNSIVETGMKLSRDEDWEHRMFFLGKQLTDENSYPKVSREEIFSKMIGLDDEVIDYIVDRTLLFSDSSQSAVLENADMDEMASLLGEVNSNGLINYDRPIN